MNENLPYEDELKKRLEDLSLPNEDLAWNDMKQRLDKDDKDRPLIPPIFKGCAGYGLLLLLLTIVSLIIVDPAKWFHTTSREKHDKVDSILNKIPVVKNDTINTAPLPVNNTAPKDSPKDSSDLSNADTTHSTLLTNTSIDKRKVLNKESFDSNDYRKQNKNFTKKGKTVAKQQSYYTDSKRPHLINRPVKEMPGALKATSNSNAETDNVVDENMHEVDTHQPDSIKSDITIATIKTIENVGTTKKNNKGTVAKKNITKPDSIKQRHYYFGAGLALHQLIPVAGQKSNPFNSLGRKSSLRDYIPSLYLRLYSDKKWFIQSEFRYGAPQYTKDCIHS